MSKREFFAISLMLFAMFFGAGNFIFPPMVGRDAGTNYYVAILFFCLTAVLLPVLGVAAIAKAGSLERLTKRVDDWFSVTYVTLVYLAIGPCLAIPRACNMPFEISIKPFLAEDSVGLYLIIYAAIYFILNAIVCLKLTRVVDVVGKILTPVLLLLILVFFVFGLFHPMGEFGAPQGEYAEHAMSKAFVEGYQTMDALAALVFGIIITAAMRERGISDENKLANSTVKAGIFAGGILMLAYIMLGFLGATSVSKFGDAKNGAEILSHISNYFFGSSGRIILGVAFFLACFTTTVGLISSISTYFTKLTREKIKYEIWVYIWCIISFAIANFGLTQILKISVPILIALYPIAIVLVFLAFIDHLIDSNRLIYRACVYVAGFIGIVNAFDISKISLIAAVKNLPFYENMLGWLFPVIFVFIVTYFIYLLCNKKDNY